MKLRKFFLNLTVLISGFILLLLLTPRLVSAEEVQPLTKDNQEVITSKTLPVSQETTSATSIPSILGTEPENESQEFTITPELLPATAPKAATSFSGSDQQQSTDYSCGPAALATWIRHLGGEATEQELIVLAKTNSEEGTTFLNLKNAAISKGYTNVAVYKLNFDEINRLPLPALVYLNVEGSDIGHFAVLYKIEGENFFLKDPSEGDLTKSKADFIASFGGYAMINGSLLAPPVSPVSPQSESEFSPASPQTTDMPTVNSTAPPLQSAQRVVAPEVASDEQLCTVRGKWAFLIPLFVRSIVIRVAGHGAHHTFKLVGPSKHIQITIYQQGVKGSGINIRIPYPW